jgi:cobalt/nickel transport system permease protein
MLAGEPPIGARTPHLLRLTGTRALQPDTLARWSSEQSAIHRVDPRVKLAVLLSFILSIALLKHPSAAQLLTAVLLLLLLAVASRLPFRSLVVRSLLVIPFVGPFAAILFLSGDHGRAWSVLSKSYVSTSAVLLAVSTTPFPDLLAACKWFRVPSMMVEVTQLIYRYLFVLASQVQQMRTAFAARCGSVGINAFFASSGMVAVLFGRSYRRAEFTHQAMLARGFEGMLPDAAFRRLRWTDFVTLVAGLLFCVALHFFSK